MWFNAFVYYSFQCFETELLTAMCYEFLNLKSQTFDLKNSVWAGKRKQTQLGTE